MEPKTFRLTEEQRDTLLSYLYRRPYMEVAKGVEMLQGLPLVGALPDAVPAPVEVKE